MEGALSLFFEKLCNTGITALLNFLIIYQWGDVDMNWIIFLPEDWLKIQILNRFRFRYLTYFKMCFLMDLSISSGLSNILV